MAENKTQQMQIKGAIEMVQINLRSIEKIEKQRNTIHEEVPTTYTVFEYDGDKYIQFDTYGKKDRKNPEKISQSIQLNRESAKFILDLLRSEFNL
jgi:hypothetical protein